MYSRGYKVAMPDKVEKYAEMMHLTSSRIIQTHNQKELSKTG